MNSNEEPKEPLESQTQSERDPGQPLVVDWADSDWFQVWLRLARHEPVEAAA
jgi:hypothetical protein